MQDVTLAFIGGPLQGQRIELEVADQGVIIGRQPDRGGLELKGADSSVSRSHARLLSSGGDIVLENLSPNGTKVNEQVTLDRVTLQPGDQVTIGDRYAFSIQWKSFAAELARGMETEEPGSVVSQGALASPVVRAVIAVYLLGMVGVAVWFALQDSDTGIPDEWAALELAYQDYVAEGVSDQERAARIARADALVEEIRILRTRKVRTGVSSICREIMSLDKDVRSPFFQYGAACVGSRYLGN